MFSVTDTIVAIATPPGRGGIGVVRVSGPEAQRVAQRLITHDGPLVARHATFTRLRSAVDHGIVTFFPAPHSYTGDDVVEVSAHGSPVVLRAIVSAAIDAGARLAEPGEFTLRAFLNGRMDLMQAEAVADLIEAATPLQARAAFDQLDGTLTRAIGDIDAALFDLIARLEASVDFPDEGYHFVEPGALDAAIAALMARTGALVATSRGGRLIREGLTVAIVGAPNVGKSSLFNALVGSARAIVAEVPGTTRDLVSEMVDIDGLRVTLVDTAGLREVSNDVEREGVARARQSAAVADLVLAVEDRSRARDGNEGAARPAGGKNCKVLCIANKSDLPAAWHDEDALEISAATGAGLEELRRRILSDLDVEPARDRAAITNIRHGALIDRAHGALARARAALASHGGALPEEFVLADLADARAALEEVTGRRTTEDLLEHIFSRFCIGK